MEFFIIDPDTHNHMAENCANCEECGIVMFGIYDLAIRDTCNDCGGSHIPKIESPWELLERLKIIDRKRHERNRSN